MKAKYFRRYRIIFIFILLGITASIFKIYFQISSHPTFYPSNKQQNYSANSAKFVWPTYIPKNSQKVFSLFVLKNSTFTNLHSVSTMRGTLFNDTYYFPIQEQNTYLLKRYSLIEDTEKQIFSLPKSFSLKGIDTHAIALVHKNYPDTPLIYMIDPSTNELITTFPSSVNANGDPQYLFKMSDGNYVFWIPDGDGCVSEGLVAKGKTTLHNILTLGMGCNQDPSYPMYLGMSQQKKAIIVGKFTFKQISSQQASSCAYNGNLGLHYTQLLYYYPSTETFENITDLGFIPDPICEMHVVSKEKLQIMTTKQVIIYDLINHQVERTVAFNDSKTFWHPLSDTTLYYLADDSKELRLYNLLSQQQTSYSLDTLGVDTQSTTFEKYQFVGNTSDGSPIFLLQMK